MNATKRKFNTLLQGLGQPRTSTDGSRPGAKPSNAAISSRSDVLKRARQGQSSTTLSPSTTLKSTTPTVLKKKEPEKPLAKYCPSDRKELLRRLATFQEITDWTPKPDKVSEIEWARRGWICTGKERVRCILCNKELLVKLNKKEVDGKEVPVLVASEIEAALVDKYYELTVGAHREDCLWRRQGCDASLLRLQISTAASTLEGLRQRYDELCARKPFLPYEFNLRLPEGLSIDNVLAELPPDFFKPSSPIEESSNQQPNRVAFALALTGWEGLLNPRMGPVPNSARCGTCLRRLGLWMFKSREVDEEGNVLVPAPMDFLDPVREHRFFCPWKNPEAQKRSTTTRTQEEPLPGWQTLLQTLGNDAHLRSVYEGRPSTRPKSAYIGSAPSTPAKSRPLSVPGPMTPATPGGGDGAATAMSPEEEEKEREAKDKERWARLRRVKSLFEAKSKKLRRPGSRPGTAHSTKSTMTTGTTDGNKELEKA